VHERIVEIETADGTMPVFNTQPESGGPFAPVVLFMDIWGYREIFCDLARRIRTVGYAAVLPDHLGLDRPADGF
jgi:dienelactone hydrolase